MDGPLSFVSSFSELGATWLRGTEALLESSPVATKTLPVASLIRTIIFDYKLCCAALCTILNYELAACSGRSRGKIRL